MALQEFSSNRLEESVFCLECGYGSETIYKVDECLLCFINKNSEQLLNAGKFEVLASLLNLDCHPTDALEDHIRSILSEKEYLYRHCLTVDKNGNLLPASFEESRGAGLYYYTDKKTGCNCSVSLPEDQAEKASLISSLIEKRNADPDLFIEIHSIDTEGNQIVI
jgi:hypothetical protein